MKKTLLFLLAIVPLLSTAQIAPITTEQKTYEFIHDNKLIKNNKTGQYILQIISTNQFEDKVVHLKLGTEPQAAMQSILNLYNVLKNVDTEFNLQSYSFYVQEDGLTVLHKGPLEFAAGYYVIYKDNIIDIIETLIETYNLPIGGVHIRCRNLDVRKFYICYDDYGFYGTVRFPSPLPVLSKKYAENEVVLMEDLQLLYDYAIKRGAFVANGPIFIRACEIILNDSNK